MSTNTDLYVDFVKGAEPTTIEVDATALAWVATDYCAMALALGAQPPSVDAYEKVMSALPSQVAEPEDERFEESFNALHQFSVLSDLLNDIDQSLSDVENAQ